MAESVSRTGCMMYVATSSSTPLRCDKQLQPHKFHGFLSRYTSNLPCALVHAAASPCHAVVKNQAEHMSTCQPPGNIEQVRCIDEDDLTI